MFRYFQVFGTIDNAKSLFTIYEVQTYFLLIPSRYGIWKKLNLTFSVVTVSFVGHSTKTEMSWPSFHLKKTEYQENSLKLAVDWDRNFVNKIFDLIGLIGLDWLLLKYSFLSKLRTLKYILPHFRWMKSPINRYLVRRMIEIRLSDLLLLTKIKGKIMCLNYSSQGSQTGKIDTWNWLEDSSTMG